MPSWDCESPNIPRMLAYWPAASAAALFLRENECRSGSHMFDWPEQYHTSPKVTSCRRIAVREILVYIVEKCNSPPPLTG